LENTRGCGHTMLRICVVGSGGVGKSCVTIRFLKNEFTEVRATQLKHAIFFLILVILS